MGIQNPQLTTLSLRSSLNKSSSRIGPDGLTKSREVGTFRFDQGDTMALIKNGFGWTSGGGQTIDAPPGLSETGVRYTWTASPDPTVDTTSEKRFYFKPMDEFCFKMRFHVPANYFHRRCLGINVSGDISSWAVGDIVVGGDSTSDGTIYWINGAIVYLLFADNSLQAAPIWTANVTNTTRSQTRAATRIGNEPDNNKLLAFWCDGYSSAGGSPSIAWEMRGDGAGGSILYYHFGANFKVVGTLPNSTSPEATFIRPSDTNKWFDLIVYIKMATSDVAEDGIIRTFVRREGESNYTVLHNQTNAMIGARAGGQYALFQNGYCHGWSNSGFQQETIIRDSMISLNTSSIDNVGK